MTLRDELLAVMGSHGTFDMALLDGLERTMLARDARNTQAAAEAAQAQADTAAEAWMQDLRRQVEHRAGLLRVVTNETAADPTFRATMAAGLTAAVYQRKPLHPTTAPG